MHFLTMTHRIVTKIHIFKVHFHKECTYIRSALVQIKECSYTNTFFNNEKWFQAKNYFVYLWDHILDVATYIVPIWILKNNGKRIGNRVGWIDRLKVATSDMGRIQNVPQRFMTGYASRFQNSLYIFPFYVVSLEVEVKMTRIIWIRKLVGNFELWKKLFLNIGESHHDINRKLLPCITWVWKNAQFWKGKKWLAILESACISSHKIFISIGPFWGSPCNIVL